MTEKLRVGVVGYSDKKFDKTIAKALLLIGFKVSGIAPFTYYIVL